MRIVYKDAMLNGPWAIIVKSNTQDCVGNTMNDGKVVVHGNAGDVLGYGMRGGRLFIKGDVGYRVGIHMKAYMDKNPVLIAGGFARDFLGEYMAGGLLIVLGLNRHNPVVGKFIGTGTHGGSNLHSRESGRPSGCERSNYKRTDNRRRKNPRNPP